MTIVLSCSRAARSAGFPFQIEAEVAVGDLVLLPTEAPFLSLDYGFVTRRGHALSPAAKAFMALAREVERGTGAVDPMSDRVRRRLSAHEAGGRRLAVSRGGVARGYARSRTQVSPTSSCPNARWGALSASRNPAA